MFDALFRSRRVRNRVAQNVLKESLYDLVFHLHARGHAISTIQNYVQACEHFGQWLYRTRRPVISVTEATVREFIERHLSACTCPIPANRTISTIRAALRHLLDVLRATNRLVTRPLLPLTHVDRLVGEYEAYLTRTCGTADATRRYYVRNTRRFLIARFGNRDVDLRRLTVTDVVQYVTAYAANSTAGTMKTVTTSLRSFLRFGQMEGLCGASIVAAVPSIPEWRLASLPKVLTDEQVRGLLSTFDPTTATGRRDRAIVLFLSELALRANEVAALTLNDIDWRGGTVTIAPSKSRRADRMPLPANVARAVLAYLRDGRPRTGVRNLFVRHRAPFGQSITPGIVRGVVRRGYARSPACRGLTRTYFLRHTAASRLLRAGASLKEVADLLRHRSFDTTAIYAKVDVPSLVEVAQPWPEVP